MANPFLITAAALSATAALLHVGCIIFGASWYRVFGAGKHMVRLAASGSMIPTIITAGITMVLALWSLYALSAAGLIPALPLIRIALCAITGIYLLRGVAGLVLGAMKPGDQGAAFWLWSSIICLSIGVVHLVGTLQVWSQLSHGWG